MYRVFAEIMKPEIDAMVKEASENGYSSGYGNGLCENILSLLEDFGEVTEEIKNYILSEKDISKLKTWNKIAARAESIEDFCKKIQE